MLIFIRCCNKDVPLLFERSRERDEKHYFAIFSILMLWWSAAVQKVDYEGSIDEGFCKNKLNHVPSSWHIAFP
jgi:hypothetical protein